MGVKFRTGAWESDESDNQHKRDARRAAFWSELGVTPAKDVAEVDLDPGARLANMATLVAKTVAGRETNGQMRAAAALAGGAVAQLGLGSLALDVASLLPGWMKLQPMEMKSHFLEWHRTAFEESKFGN